MEKQHSLRCLTVTLPSTQGDPNATFKNDVDAAQKAITDETTQGRNIVVIAHSYGGMVGNSAIKGLAKPIHPQTPADQGNGYVIGLILIASGFTLTGLSFMDPLFGHPPPAWRVNKGTGFADIVVSPRDLFYHDVPVEEADYWVSQLTSQSLKALFEGGEHAYAGWLDVPAWYIGTVEDRGLPVALQRVNVGMARGMGGSVVHIELQTSHSPFLSRPKEVVEIIVDAVECFNGQARDVSKAKAVQNKLISLPAVRLWQPTTWFRFGIPLGLGRAVGWGVAGFLWTRRSWRSAFR